MMWECQSCGAQFKSIPHDEGVKRCCRCVENEVLKAEVERLRGEIRRLTGTQGPGDLARPFEECEHIGEDGCCEHPKSMTGECHYGTTCGKFEELLDEVERLKGERGSLRRAGQDLLRTGKNLGAKVAALKAEVERLKVQEESNLKPYADGVALHVPEAPKVKHIEDLIRYCLTVHKRFGNTAVAFYLSWGSSALRASSDDREHIATLRTEVERLKGKLSRRERILYEISTATPPKDAIWMISTAGNAFIEEEPEPPQGG